MKSNFGIGHVGMLGAALDKRTYTYAEVFWTKIVVEEQFKYWASDSIGIVMMNSAIAVDKKKATTPG